MSTVLTREPAPGAASLPAIRALDGAAPRLPGLEDERDLQAARAGGEAAFAALVRRHQAVVYSLALRILGHRQDAEEIAQDAFLQLYRALPRLESCSHLRFWLRRTTSHRAIDRLRRRERERATTAVGQGDEGTGETDFLVEARLRQLLLGLPAAARAVMVLRYQEDLDPADIAATLDLPVNTVKSHLRRSLATLREQAPGELR